jgi:hypothetical protein
MRYILLNDNVVSNIIEINDPSCYPLDINQKIIQYPSSSFIDIGYVYDDGASTFNSPLQQVPDISIDTLISNLWQLYNDFAESQMDFNSRHTIDMLLSQKETLPTTQYQKIVQYANWWGNLWTSYAIQKQKILSGDLTASFDLTSVGNCPYTIWDLTQSS